MDYVKKTEALLTQVKEITRLDFKVLKVEWVKEDGNYYLRAYCDMDQEGGIGAEDLAKITRPLNKLLDKEDFIPEQYTLEVCSPGYLNNDPDAWKDDLEAINKDINNDKTPDDQEESDHE